MTRLLLLITIGTAIHAQEISVRVIASAYCPCSLCCNVRTERTANGTSTNDRPYGVAASPNIPLGSIAWIPAGSGYMDSTFTDRWFTVDDRGGALRREWRDTGITRIDLRFKTHAAAKAFGRKLITIYIQQENRHGR